MNPSEWIRHAYKETRRILRLTRKPHGSEFQEIAKITGLGVLAIGFIGLVILVAFTLLNHSLLAR